MFAKVYTLFRPLLKTFDFLMPVGDLTVRLWVAHIFFKAALTKIQVGIVRFYCLLMNIKYRFYLLYLRRTWVQGQN